MSNSNDHRSNSLNPNNSAYDASEENRRNQLGMDEDEDDDDSGVDDNPRMIAQTPPVVRDPDSRFNDGKTLHIKWVPPVSIDSKMFDRM